MFTASELFDLAIQVEVNGERFYRYALSVVARGSTREVLGWLADQESQHKTAFLKLKEKAMEEEKPDRPKPDEAESLALRAAMGRHAFSLDELHIDSIQDDQELLQAAVAFEEDAILFFEFVSSFVSDPQALSIIEEIRGEELNHKKLLMEKMATG